MQTKDRRTRSKTKPQPQSKPQVSSGRSRDALRVELARKLYTMLEYPRRCRDYACRRARRCVGPTLRCAADLVPPPVSADEGDLRIWQLRKLLRNRVRELGG